MGKKSLRSEKKMAVVTARFDGTTGEMAPQNGFGNGFPDVGWKLEGYTYHDDDDDGDGDGCGGTQCRLVCRSSSPFLLTSPCPGANPLWCLTARASHISEEKGPTARVLFDFTPTSPFELAVSGMSWNRQGTVRLFTTERALADSIVHVLKEDDGSGWVKVADESGGQGGRGRADEAEARRRIPEADCRVCVFERAGNDIRTDGDETCGGTCEERTGQENGR
ncbi:hypothetical protein NUW54_g14370 [Trametes sanguinea]|uniref:Uncharacterized protein n=1 Tax=Trametes sanguinea TaxID=158606 RepID=A0ACC1MCM9_9APHY|nr:hypothetical protein NUW54_g14370 [Trametes sanguinea]